MSKSRGGCKGRVVVAVIVPTCGEAVGLHMAGGEADGNNGLFGVNCLREQVMIERNGANVLEHCAGVVLMLYAFLVTLGSELFLWSCAWGQA